MKAILLVAGIVLATPVFGADDKAAVLSTEPTLRDARAAVQRSLPYIEKVSTTWMTEKKCNSCHVVTFHVWSHNLALARGFDVDKKKLAEWTQWALGDSLSDRFFFKLRPHTMEALKSDGVDATVLAKLKPLVGVTHVTEKLFNTAAEKALGHEDFERCKDKVIKHATLPKNGGGSDTLAQLLLGRNLADADQTQAASYKAVRALLLEWQLPDGSWAAEGQLPSLKWDGVKEANDATTMWSLLALNASAPVEDALVVSRQKALEYLKTSGPGKTVQTRALRLIVAQQFRKSPQVEASREELLSRQNADGGWSWWNDNKTSDAFATGQALYALGMTGGDHRDPAVSKAWRFLIQTQGKDGSWEEPQEPLTTRVTKLNVFTFWGTAWAAIGLMQTMPATESPRPAAGGG